MAVFDTGVGDMTYKKKLKTVDGFKIHSVHTISKGRGVVLWLHGITVDMNEYLGFFKDGVKYLASKGIDSQQIDFRGHGRSSGTSMDFTIVGQMLDVGSALEYLDQKYDLGNTALHIVGCSFGAPPAIFSAIRYTTSVKSIVLIAPVLSYVRTFLEPETDWGQSIFNEKTLASLAGTRKLLINDKFPIGVQLVEEMRLIQPNIALSQVKQKIVIVHGDADSMVPFLISKEIASHSLTIRLVTIPGMDHGFMDSKDETGLSLKSIENKKQIYELIYGLFS
jgi:pimeloyl-ACP methyl ester carboxylesterase